ncbi:MAG: hypothetical protein M1835_006865, partial [Candelina submexicana]
SISGRGDRSCSPYLEIPLSRKVNVRKPAPGIKDWFDDIIEDEDIDDLTELTSHGEYSDKETVIAPAAVEDGAKPSGPMHRCTPLCEHDQLHPERDLSVSYRSSQTVSDFGGSSVCPTTIWSGDVDSARSISSRASRRSKKSRTSIFVSSDLRQESVLALSSSEDEGGLVPISKGNIGLPVNEQEEPDVMIYNGRTHLKRTSTAPTEVLSLRGPRPRMSIHSTSVREGTSSGAGALSLTSPRHSIKGKLKNTTTSVPNCKQLGKEKPKEELSRLSPMKAETLRPRTSGNDSNKRSSWLEESPPPPSPTVSEGRPHQTRKSRIMAVTREEESLLEAMRQKRSTMQKHSFVEGYKTALHNVTATTIKTAPVAPPATPNTTEALSFLQLNTSFPNPPKSNRKMNKLGSPGRVVASFASASSCTSSPTEIIQPASQISFLPTQTPISPTLHISVPDILPSPPNSRGSPVTPPSSNGLLNARKGPMDGNGITQSLSRSTNRALLSVTGGDGRIDEQDLDGEELAIWGLNEWSGTEGLVAVR